MMRTGGPRTPVSTRRRLGEHPARAGPHRWSVDTEGRIIDFDMKLLRDDVMYRIDSGAALYTLEECKALLQALARVAARWQETEVAQLLYLAELSNKLLPGQKVVYQFPPAAVPVVPPSTSHDALQDSPLYNVTRIVEDLNRSMVRMVDTLLNDRRERMLLAARMLQDLEKAVPTAE
jgi:hypothetical protein